MIFRQLKQAAQFRLVFVVDVIAPQNLTITLNVESAQHRFKQRLALLANGCLDRRIMGSVQMIGFDKIVLLVTDTPKPAYQNKPCGLRAIGCKLFWLSNFAFSSATIRSTGPLTQVLPQAASSVRSLRMFEPSAEIVDTANLPLLYHLLQSAPPEFESRCPSRFPCPSFGHKVVR